MHDPTSQNPPPDSLNPETADADDFRWSDDSRWPNGITPLSTSPPPLPTDQTHTHVDDEDLDPEALAKQQRLAALQANGTVPMDAFEVTRLVVKRFPSVLILFTTLFMLLGWSLNWNLITLLGALITFGLSLRLIWPNIKALTTDLSSQQKALIVGLPGLAIALVGLMQALGIIRWIFQVGDQLRWDVIGALGDFFGAFGQILIAVLAVYVAWRQYIIERDLTTQQNLITQQQTIDSYFQGVSDLVLDDEGLLEDWPQERAIAEGRTAAILSSINAEGKAKVIRFLSQSRLLTPLQRDRHLGRPILDGTGGYAEDRVHGVRVIDLGVMLANSDLSGTDLRWTDLSDVNLVRSNLSNCDLVRVNFARAILYEAKLVQTDLMGAQFFYGDVESASPRSRIDPPNYQTGENTGAVVEGADFTNVHRMTDDQRYYCCCWGGSKTRSTIPGGCGDIPNKLGR